MFEHKREANVSLKSDVQCLFILTALGMQTCLSVAMLNFDFLLT